MVLDTFSNVCCSFGCLIGPLFQDVAHFITVYVFLPDFLEFFIHSGYWHCVGYKFTKILPLGFHFSTFDVA